MSIPESQLEKWSAQGAVTGAQQTLESIVAALSSHIWPVDASYRVYLHGSYNNATNIRADNDVDVVVELDSTFRSETSGLSSAEVVRYNQDRSAAAYGWQEFRAEVFAALVDFYGLTTVTQRTRTIRVRTPHLVARVVPAIQYRKYLQYCQEACDYVQGIAFYLPAQARWLVNYPESHLNNGVAKDWRTGGRYKETVRIFKNACAHLYNRGHIDARIAPSYFLECMLYNVPDSRFAERRQQTYLNVLSAIVNGDRDRFQCQDEQRPLFGETPEQWSERSALRLTGILIDLWGR